MTHRIEIAPAVLERYQKMEAKALEQMGRLPPQARGPFAVVGDSRAEVVEHLGQVLAKRDWTLEAKFAMFDDTKLKTRQHVDMAIAEADEIQALCKIQGISALFSSSTPASDFIAARTPLDAVRARILDMRAEKSEASHIDTSPPISRDGTAADVWAIRRKQQEASR